MKTREAGLAEFHREREMFESARKWLSLAGFMTKAEFRTPWGICDLVGVLFNESRVQQRLRLGQTESIGPPLRIELLNRIPDFKTGRAVGLGRLEREFGEFLSPSELRKETDALLARKFVKTNPAGSLQKLNGWLPLHDRVVAVELKLNRVECALNQAKSHLRIADQSYVGLPANVALAVAQSKRVNAFRDGGVGIIAITRDSCEVVLSPRRTNPKLDDIMQAHCLERFWRTRLTGNSA